MKKSLIGLASMLLIAGSIGVANATPVTFNLAGSPSSSVIATDTNTGFTVNGDITATLATDLGLQEFTLNDGETREVDFFTLTTTGLALSERYTIAATLAFDLPSSGISSGSGAGTFGTFYGFFSGGTLTWNPATLPDFFMDSIGNTIRVNFQNGMAIGFGNTATVHAYITNEGGAPVPEPATMLLMGTGLAGLIAARRRKANKA